MLTANNIMVLIALKYAPYLNNWKTWEDPWIVIGNGWSQLEPQSHAIGILELSPSQRKAVVNNNYGFNKEHSVFAFNTKNLENIKAMLNSGDLIVELGG